MTREEASKQLKFILNDTRDGQIIELTDYSREAIRTVVDILSQEPCEDCVSRKELLKCSMRINDNLVAVPVKDIRETPTVQPTKIHAEWLFKINYLECSRCHYGVNPYNNTPYCPNCGAKMEGEAENGNNNQHN